MKIRKDWKVERIKEGKERDAHWAALTPAQKLQELDLRLGQGIGAMRQRKKLAKALENDK